MTSPTPRSPSRCASARRRSPRSSLRRHRRMAKLPAAPPGSAVATFAGGCFWCMEQPFDKHAGRHRHDVRLHRRDESESHLRGSVERRHRPHRGRAGALRPGESVATKSCSTCSGTTSIRRSTGPPVLRRRAASTGPGSSCTTTSSGRPRKRRRRRVEKTQAVQGSRSSRRSPPRPSSGRPRSTTRTTTGKNPVRYNYYRTGCGRDARLKQLWGSAAPH